MKFKYNQYRRFEKQIILKKIGLKGQKKIFSSKVLVVGLGGLGCPLLIYLANSGIGKIGIVDFDKIELSNLNRQILFGINDIGKYKVNQAKKVIKKINKKIKIKSFNEKLSIRNINKICKDYDIICDGTDNFKAKFLLNKFSLKYKKKLIIGAISKFEGHIFTFDFSLKKSPCLKCFYQGEPAEGVLDCETDGILGSTAVITGSLQANEVLKTILNVGKNLNSHIFIIDLLNLKFRKVLFRKKKGCICENI